jgi:hypothetical protein
MIIKSKDLPQNYDTLFMAKIEKLWLIGIWVILNNYSLIKINIIYFLK